MEIRKAYAGGECTTVSEGYLSAHESTDNRVAGKDKANISPDRLMRIYQLKGKVLGCYCTPKRCHCDYLAELANSLE
jgi:hypothetical protein